MAAKKIEFPKEDEHLSEFFGILAGDGYVNQYLLPKRNVSVIEITGNLKKDFIYIKGHVSRLVEKLFFVKPKIYLRENQNTIRLIIYSQEIVNFLREKDFPFGNKGEIVPQKWILENPLFLRKFIRGFFDTDGHLSLKNKENKKYPSIGLASKSKSLLKIFQDFLKNFGTSSYLGIKTKNSLERGHKLDINGRKNVQLFFENFGSKNQRNLSKYEEMLHYCGHQQT